ncbi:MAG: hypothetical protein J7452_06270 [Thermoflexus sp.]|jgi:hypothetical protein|nr:hypothetical protein [Thermoflexus sp.]
MSFIADLQPESMGLAAQADGVMGDAGVAGRVVQRLLKRPVEGDLSGGRERGEASLRLQIGRVTGEDFMQGNHAVEGSFKIRTDIS